MAKIVDPSAAYMPLPKGIARGNPVPIDKTLIWSDEDDLKEYAADTNGTSYVGQILTLITDGKAVPYIIRNTAGDLEQIPFSSEVSGSVGPISGQIPTITSNIATISGRVNTLSGNLTNVSSALSTVSSTIGNVSSNLVSLSSSVGTISGYSKTTDNVLSGRITTLSSTVGNVSSSLVTLSGRVETISGYSKTADNVLSGRIATLSSNVKTISGYAETADKALASSISTLSGKAETTDKNLSSLIMTISGNAKAVDVSLAGSIQSLNTAISERIATSSIATSLNDKSTNTTVPGTLATYQFVNSSIQSLASYYLTKDAAGNSFATKAELNSAISSGTFYNGGQLVTPKNNDYTIVQADESHSSGQKPTTRYSYDGKQWAFQYILNNTTFTEAQLNAINSGVTADKINTITSNISTVSSTVGNVSSNLVSLSSSVGTISGYSKTTDNVLSGRITTLSGYLTNYAPKTSPTLSGVVTAQRMIVSGGVDVSATSDNNGPLIVGIRSGEHLAIDGNEIIAKASGTTGSTLYLNNEGQGLVIVGMSGTDASKSGLRTKNLWVDAVKSALLMTDSNGKVYKQTTNEGLIYDTKGTISYKTLGTGSGQVAKGDHTHTSLPSLTILKEDSVSEGGEITLQTPSTSYSNIHLDNYQGYFRVYIDSSKIFNFNPTDGTIDYNNTKFSKDGHTHSQYVTTSTMSSYVNVTGTQSITGVKTFTSSTTFNNSIKVGSASYGSASIEMYGPSSGTHGGFIDFHYAASTADYTSRIIEDASGLLLSSTTGKVRLTSASGKYASLDKSPVDVTSSTSSTNIASCGWTASNFVTKDTKQDISGSKTFGSTVYATAAETVYFQTTNSSTNQKTWIGDGNMWLNSNKPCIYFRNLSSTQKATIYEADGIISLSGTVSNGIEIASAVADDTSTTSKKVPTFGLLNSRFAKYATTSTTSTLSANLSNLSGFVKTLSGVVAKLDAFFA